MATTIAVLYPNAADATFDMDYDMSKHMPLVADRFGSHGMTAWRVVRLDATPTGAAPFSVMATLEFGSADGFMAAVTAEGAAVFGDVPNFSNKQPQVMIGEVTGHG